MKGKINCFGTQQSSFLSSFIELNVFIELNEKDVKSCFYLSSKWLSSSTGITFTKLAVSRSNFYRSMVVDLIFKRVFGTGTVGPCAGPQISGELTAMNAICRHLCRSTEFAAHHVTGSDRSQKTFHRPVSEKSIVVCFIEIR